MNWYSIFSKNFLRRKERDIQMAIIPIDSLKNEKVGVSEKLICELKGYLTDGWKKAPSYIPISYDKDYLIGEETVIHANGIYRDDNILALRFNLNDDDNVDNNKLNNLYMLVSYYNTFPNSINNIDKWQSIDNDFSIYCFFANITKNFDIII